MAKEFDNDIKTKMGWTGE